MENNLKGRAAPGPDDATETVEEFESQLNGFEEFVRQQQ